MRRFWKAVLAGKLAMLCLRVGALGCARWLVDYEGRENKRVVLRGLRRR